MKYFSNEAEFKKMFSKGLYDKIQKECIIRFKRNITKKEYNAVLGELYEQLNRNEISIDPIEDKVFLYKSNDVARIIPVFTIKNELLYYFLLKVLEDEIAINRIENTFGGWRLGNKIRLYEDQEIEYVLKSYNPLLWNENWKLFINVIINKVSDNDYNDENGCVLKLDIANFYDSINLEILNNNLLASIGKEKIEFVNILYYFLKSWNLKDENYNMKTKGLPQNEFGDQSRLLANFYLQSYDKEIKEFCDARNATYIRYADDQVIVLRNKVYYEEIMYKVCKELNKIGLNINASKVKKYNKDEIKKLYGLSIFNLIDEEKYDEAAELFIDFYNDESLEFKYPSVLKRILNIGLDKLNASNNHTIKGIILNEKFLKDLDDYYLTKIYNNLLEEEKNIYINDLLNLAEKINYNSFHYNLINFINKNKIQCEVDSVYRRIEYINNL